VTHFHDYGATSAERPHFDVSGNGDRLLAIHELSISGVNGSGVLTPVRIQAFDTNGVLKYGVSTQIPSGVATELFKWSSHPDLTQTSEQIRTVIIRSRVPLLMDGHGVFYVEVRNRDFPEHINATYSTKRTLRFKEVVCPAQGFEWFCVTSAAMP
jgi:hypothetical protein